MLCLMLGLTMASAVSIHNVNNDYNKKDNIVSFSFDKVLNDECVPVDVTILDHKDNVVGGYSSYGTICAICLGGSCSYFSATGTYSVDKIFNLIPKNQIKGLGNLRYEISRTYGDEILAEGRLK